jgi:pimeloyl-ACP methyl ester carboxylesterase
MSSEALVAVATRPVAWESRGMSTFVVVHGGFGGAWEWTPVARRLRARGHEVFTPTLTGMGERAHLAAADVGLSTHVEDVVAAVETEDLDDVVLCGHSYGGLPVTGAADRLSKRIGLLIYIDALVPRDGQSALDVLPAWFAAEARATADERGRVPMPAVLAPPRGWIDDAERTRYLRRMRPQPLGSFTEPVRLSGAVDRLPAAFVRCARAAPPGDPIAAIAERARARGWMYRELAAPHDPQLLDPDGTAHVLHELASSIPRTSA